MKFDFEKFIETFSAKAEKKARNVLRYLVDKAEPYAAPKVPVKTPAQIENETWIATKNVLSVGLDPYRKAVLDVLLENAKKDVIRTSALSGGTGVDNRASMLKVILPLTRRLVENTNIFHWIGVQPMTGPIGQVHALQVLEQNGKTQVQILKQTVEAKTRRLSATWTIESANQDAQARYGIDVEAEIMAVVAQEVNVELEMDIISSLTNLATRETVRYVDMLSPMQTPSNSGLIKNTLEDIIKKKLEDMGLDGKPTESWIILPTHLYKMLKEEIVIEKTDNASSSVISFVGTILDGVKVFVNPYISYDKHEILFGSKGTSEADTFAIYCPYMLLTSTGAIIHPDTFECIIGFLTRYGFIEIPNSRRKVSLVTIENIN